MPNFDITSHGAVGDGETLSTTAIQETIDACHESGGGRVSVPAGGRFLTGSIELKSHVDLHVERGAVLLASDSREDLTARAFGESSGKEEGACIVARNAEDIAITGDGTIDGQGCKWMADMARYIYRPKPGARPMLICFIGCRRVTMRDITIRDSANWAVHPAGCADVLISGVRILNDTRLPNCDGIDPDHCRDVRISDCYIQAGDDGIVIKTRKEFPNMGPSENITIANCVVMSTSAAIKIGTESVDDFRNITISNCVIKSSNRGLAIQLRDSGSVENVLFSNCTVETRHFSPEWWGRAEPIYVTAIHRAAGTDLGRVRNVRFRNIVCRSESGAFIAGSEDSPVEDVVLDSVRIEIDKWSKWPGGWHDRRPCMNPDTGHSIEPEKDAGLTNHRTAGVYAEHARNVALRNTDIVWGANTQDHWGEDIETHDADVTRS